MMATSTNLLLTVLLEFSTGILISTAAVARPTDLANNARSATTAQRNDRRVAKTTRGRISVGKLFNSAMAKFEAAQYQEALVAFDRLLQRYPGFQPTNKMMGRTLYKLDRYPEAWSFFIKVPPQELDPDTAYEFGVVAFNARQYEPALMAFKKVPDGHSWHDLAGYYGGLSAIKLKKYDEAERLLRQAQVLPDRLARSRAVYLKHVQSIKLMQEKSELQREREQERQRIMRKAGGPGLAGGTKASPNGNQPATPPPTSTTPTANSYSHQGFKSISKMMSFRGEQRSQQSSNSNLAESSTNLRIGSFRFQNGPMLSFSGQNQSIKPGQNGQQNAFGFQLLFGGEDRGVSGRERRIVITESDQDIVRVQQSSVVKSHTQYAYVGADPWLEFNMGANLWLNTGVSGYFEYPDFKREGRTGIIKGTIGLGAKRGWSRWMVSGSAGSLYDTNNRQITDTKEGSLSLSHNFSDSTSGEIEGTIKDFHYKDQSLDGPDQSISLAISFSHQLLPGLQATAFTAYEKQKNAFFYGLPEVSELSADGDVVTAQATLGYSPASWISLDLSQIVSQTKWSVHNTESEKIFKENVPNYLSLFKGGVSILFPF